MAIFKSGNPAMNVFKNTVTLPGSGTMTETGTLNKFFLVVFTRHGICFLDLESIL